MVFDFFILVMMLDKVFDHRKTHIPYYIYIACFVVVEFVLYANMFIPYPNRHVSLISSFSISIITTFALTFLYNGALKHRIFVALSFQLFSFLSECLITFLVSHFAPEIFNIEENPLMAIMNFGTKITLIIIVICFIEFWNIKLKKYEPHYNILLFTTPAITIILITCIPLVDIAKSGNYSFYIILLCGLIILNITNYMLLEHTFHISELKTLNAQMNQQIVFQKDKYKQLSAAYRNTRSIVHDTKKHYLAISSFVQNKEYEKLNGYMFSAIDNLESTYARINTGSLVIDSFVSNYMAMAENEGISTTTDIGIDPNCIPVDDYDLCVVLGNMFDNSLAACRQISDESSRFINISIHTDNNNKFILHTSNSYSQEYNIKNKSSSSLAHGYGLNNIRKIIDKYHGLFDYKENETFDVYIVIPILGQNNHQQLYLAN